MYVVFGANGRAGGETARALIEQGTAVRLVVRRAEHGSPWKALGAEIAIADLEDVMSIASALDGASGAFVLNPTPSKGDPYARTLLVGNTIARAVKLASVPKLVALSSIGAHHVDGTGIIRTLHQFESLLDGAAPAVVFLRSAYFVETWGDVAAAAKSGVLPTFIAPDQRIPMVSTIDVGRAAASLIAETWSGNRVVELSAPSDLSAEDIAKAFANVLDHPVETAFVPQDQRAAVLRSDGVDSEIGAALLEMYDGIARGKFQREDGTEWRRGTVSLVEAIARMLKAPELRP